MKTNQNITPAANAAASSTTAPAPLGKDCNGNPYLARGSYRTADGKAQIDWDLAAHREDGRALFSACGEFNGGGGQNIDKIAAAYPEDAKVQEIAKIWGVYHLNDITAGTPAQMAEITRRRVLAEDEARKHPDARRYFYDAELADPNWHSLCTLFGADSYYSWECAILKEAGLYEIPLPDGTIATGGVPEQIVTVSQAAQTRKLAESGQLFPTVSSGDAAKLSDLQLAERFGQRGYRFGELWLYSPIPPAVVEQIKGWAAVDNTAGESHHDANARLFLANHGITLRITLSDTKPAHWEPAGHHYRITLSRKRQPGRLAFDFWGSVKDAEEGEDPTAYDVLACIASDLYCPETFEDFCSEYGMDTEEPADRWKALQTFNRSSKHAARLRAFFSDEGEREELGTIK